MLKKDFNLAVIQMVSTANFLENISVAEKLIIKAANSGANIAVLPEYFSFMGMREEDKFEHVERHLDGLMQSSLSKIASDYNIWIVAGSHPIESGDIKRPFGRCYVFDSIGEVVTWYDKIHLFDVTVGDSKGNYCESAMSTAGRQAVYFDSPWGKIGLAICYDLRFPELFRELSSAGCGLFILPAAFTHKTGKVHWEVLIKARAIENLCFFAASAQGGRHQNGRETWGHSCIVDPWGETIAELALGEGIVQANLNSQQQAKIRNEFPALSHRQ